MPKSSSIAPPNGPRASPLSKCSPSTRPNAPSPSSMTRNTWDEKCSSPAPRPKISRNQPKQKHGPHAFWKNPLFAKTAHTAAKNVPPHAKNVPPHAKNVPANHARNAHAGNHAPLAPSWATSPPASSAANKSKPLTPSRPPPTSPGPRPQQPIAARLPCRAAIFLSIPQRHRHTTASSPTQSVKTAAHPRPHSQTPGPYTRRRASLRLLSHRLHLCSIPPPSSCLTGDIRVWSSVESG